eukprot:scaffold3870_cov246-Pinguiococcus_pyrenoidosus.AAC.5
MGDVAAILGMGANGAKDPKDASNQNKSTGRKRDRKAVKPAGMSREVFSLLGAGGLPSLAPAGDAKGGHFKRRRVTGQEGKWKWTTFKNSARGDKFSAKHWQKASVEYPDYPFSRFNVSLESVVYSDEEYDKVLASGSWTRSETDYLMILCQRYDLRWPVIADRYTLTPLRAVEDMQKRYYDVVRALILYRTEAAKAAALRAAQAAVESAAGVDGGKGPEPDARGAVPVAVPGAVAVAVAGAHGDGRRADAHSLSAKVSASLARIPTSSEGIGLTLLGTGGSLDSFNADYERERREQLEALFRRTRAEEAEEAQLRAEYKALEQQLKKLKKTASTSMSSHALAPGIAQRYQNAAKQSLLDARRMISRAAPKSGEPYLMSSRLGEVRTDRRKIHPVASPLHRPQPNRTNPCVYCADRRDVNGIRPGNFEHWADQEDESRPTRV